MDRGDWGDTVHGVTESWTQRSTHTQSLRTESFNERSAPSTALPGAGNHTKRCAGALFSLNPQGPLTCLGLCCGPQLSRPILLFLQLHFLPLAVLRSASRQKGRHLNSSGGSDLFFLVNNMKQALPPPHHHHSYHEYGQTSRSTLRDTAEHLRRIPGASDQLTGPLSRGGCEKLGASHFIILTGVKT